MSRQDALAPFRVLLNRWEQRRAEGRHMTQRERIGQLQDAIELAAERPSVTPLDPACVWALTNDGEFYETACGQAFVMLDGGEPKDHQMRFCCYCGLPLLSRSPQDQEPSQTTNESTTTKT